MNKNAIGVIAVQNAIIIIVWMLFAVFFNKWWIALFSILFLSTIKNVYKQYRVCDGCGKHSPYADSYNEALEKAKQVGWKHINNGNLDYCSDCQKEMGENIDQNEDNALEERVKNAVKYAFRFGQIEGEGHKLWVIDSMVRELLGEKEYKKYVEIYETPYGDECYVWDTGVEP